MPGTETGWIAGEIAGIREAARLVAEQGEEFFAASAEFLTVGARLLHGENETCTGEEAADGTVPGPLRRPRGGDR
ncbi:hypothetical protein [Kitasatospora sp. NPDC057223]|uniref:hypothetical protein n=1 Tax=Kitasatospora sp. NPDC057223 TaxID=3346055 RepID=UPI00363270E2